MFIDVMISKEIDTFILHSGILPISNQELEVELKSALTINTIHAQNECFLKILLVRFNIE